LPAKHPYPSALTSHQTPKVLSTPLLVFWGDTA
jgi:hypothetical protein